MSEATAQVRRLCDEFGIRIISKQRSPVPGETRAVVSIARIIAKRGEPHARMVLSLLAESRGNQGLIDEVSLWAMSDLVTACADIVDDRAGDLFELMDAVPLGPYMVIASELSGVVHRRYALARMIYLHMRKLRDHSISFKDVAGKKARHALASEHEKGRLPDYRPQPKRTRQEKIELGRELLAKRAELGRGHAFQKWVIVERDITLSMADGCMKLAREADQEVKANRSAA